LHQWNRIAQDSRIAATSPQLSDRTIKWAAQLSHVREVSLRGDAGLDYWTDRLASHHLIPLAPDGRAQIMIISADARFHGVRFREVSFSVRVHCPDPALGDEAACLLGAYSSNRFFAWCERTFFATPYAHGHVRLATSPHPSVQLDLNGRPVFHADMTATQPAANLFAAPDEQGGWEGPVLLPQTGRPPAKLFFARLRGVTHTRPFTPGQDTLVLSPPSGNTAPAIAALRDSQFVPRQWEVRTDANHAKSKTYRMNDAR
jgi:hypothetical protein